MECTRYIPAGSSLPEHRLRILELESIPTAQDGRYYDVYAFRSCNAHWNPRIGPIQKKAGDQILKLMPVYPSDLAPFEVHSAFSGAAIYRADVLFGPRIWADPEGADGPPGSIQDARQRVPQWRGGELVAALPQPVSDSGSRKRERYQMPGRDPNADPLSPSYFLRAAVVAGEAPFDQETGKAIRLPVLPCVYSEGGARECEHVALTACINARARAMGIPPVHLVPDWALLYGLGSAPQVCFSPSFTCSTFASNSLT